MLAVEVVDGGAGAGEEIMDELVVSRVKLVVAVVVITAELVVLA